MYGESPPETVSIVGLGYVGLRLALAMADAGYRVVGVDVDEERVRALRDGISHVDGVPDPAVERWIGDQFVPTTDLGDIAGADGVSICVPTPLHKTRQPNLSYVADVTEELVDVIDPETTVVLESTVYPGATEELVVPILESNGYAVGKDIFVAFSPERIDPGNDRYGVRDIPKVLGGVTRRCGDRAQALYEPIFEKIVRVGSAKEAEMVKLFENSFRSVNIGLINELAMVAHEMDIDIWSVVAAADTKPFGFMRFDPGPGLGGHCIPIDPVYLSWKAGQHGMDARFIDLADEVNREMPTHVVNRLTILLNRAGKPLVDADVLVVGAAYKPDLSDTRESPAFDVIGELIDRGAKPSYHDPYVPQLDVKGVHYESRPLTSELLSKTDCAVLVTDHSCLDIDAIVEHSPLVFDTRNATATIDCEHVHRL